MRYIIAPDTEFDSGLYHVFDTQENNAWGEQKCILSYAPEEIARRECNNLNEKESGKGQ